MEKKKIIRFLILGTLLIVAVVVGANKISYMLHHEETENSQLETNIVPVLPRVGGWVTKVLVKDNQVVHIGDTLVKIDDRDLQIKVLQAEAAVKNAEANLALIVANAGTAQANVGTSDASFQAQNAGIETATAQYATAQANVESAKIRVWKATQDFNRYQQLYNLKSATQQQFDAAKADKETAEAALHAAEKQEDAAKSQLGVSKKQSQIGSSQKNVAQTQVSAAQRQIEVARTQVEQKKAELDLAKLQLSYVAVTAPSNGQIAKKNIQVGQLVNPGQPLMSIVDNTNVWVVANFKETQVGKMHVGDKVTIKVDAYGKKEIEGTIESFAGATGARFSLLPPDNSTGNFVKVVQRIPTKITIPNSVLADMPLRAGMSVDVVVPVN
jgi:membrane fusion protein (multidrug efflux system)